MTTDGATPSLEFDHEDAERKAELREDRAIERDADAKVHLDDLIEAQTIAVGELALGITKFATTFEKREDDRLASRRQTKIVIAIGLVFCLLMGLGLIRLNQIASSNKENGQTTRDCVTPTGDCFKRNRASLEEAVRRANDGNNNGILDTDELMDALGRLQKGYPPPPVPTPPTG